MRLRDRGQRDARLRHRGNIGLGGRTSPLTLPSGAVATFVRTGYGSLAYRLVGVSS